MSSNGILYGIVVVIAVLILFLLLGHPIRIG